MPGGKIPRAKNKERSLVASLRRDDNLLQKLNDSSLVILSEAKNPYRPYKKRKSDSSRKNHRSECRRSLAS
jgi:hypothetical protein